MTGSWHDDPVTRVQVRFTVTMDVHTGDPEEAEAEAEIWAADVAIGGHLADLMPTNPTCPPAITHVRTEAGTADVVVDEDLLDAAEGPE